MHCPGKSARANDGPYACGKICGIQGARNDGRGSTSRDGARIRPSGMQQIRAIKARARLLIRKRSGAETSSSQSSVMRPAGKRALFRTNCRRPPDATLLSDAGNEWGVQLRILQERDATLHREMIDLLTSPRMMKILGRQRTQKALRWFQNRRPANHHPSLAPTAYCKTALEGLTDNKSNTKDV